MRYLALACDYDGTIATNGRVDDRTLAALERVPASGRKLILVTGRELDDLQSVFPHLHLFELVVAENGALLYRPTAKEAQVLGETPPQEFIHRLRERGIAPLSVGRVIVATWEPYETAVLEVIRDMGLEMQVIFNKGAVMVLPAGINKGTGLAAAVRELALSVHNVVGVGDAENDHAFLSTCECAVAVANALPTVQQRADFVTKGDHGDGVVELIDMLVTDDLKQMEPVITRHHVLLGTRDDGREVRINPHGSNVLIAGASGSGKSTAAGGLLERLAEQGYQFCVIDPEGDYQSFEGAVVVGDQKHQPSMDEVFKLLAKPDTHSVINLLGIPLQDRPGVFAGLVPRLQEFGARTGRPHWTAVDETHHLLPASSAAVLPTKIEGMLFITVHPDQVSPAVLSAIDIVLVVGEAPEKAFEAFGRASGQSPPETIWPSLEHGQAMVWFRREQEGPFRVHLSPRRSDHRRHRRKYAQGELGPDKSFYFQGPEGKLNLRAQNLALFLQLAEGIDDATWIHHLKHHDYSRWFRDAIKNEGLAEKTERIEQLADRPPAETKTLIKEAIEEEYTLPSSSVITQ